MSISNGNTAADPMARTAAPTRSAVTAAIWPERLSSGSTVMGVNDTARVSMPITSERVLGPTAWRTTG